MSGTTSFHNDNESQDTGPQELPEVAAGLRLAVVNSAFSNGFSPTTQSNDWLGFLDQYRDDATLAAAQFPADVALFHFNRAHAALGVGDNEQADGEFIEALRFAARLEEGTDGRSSIMIAAQVNRASIALASSTNVNAQIDTLDRLLADPTLSARERLAIGLNLFLLQEKREPGSGSLELLEIAVQEGKRLPRGGEESNWLAGAACKLGMRLFEAGEIEAASIHLRTAVEFATSLEADAAPFLVPARFYLQLGLAMRGKLDEAGEIAETLCRQLMAAPEKTEVVPTLLVSLCVYAAHLVVRRQQEDAVKVMQQIARLERSTVGDLDNLSRSTFQTALKGLRQSGRRAEAKILSRFLL